MPAIEIRNLSYTYKRTSQPVLHDVNLSLGHGVVGLVGPNGAGKSTLFRLITGVLTPMHGTILIDGLAPSDYLQGHPFGFLPELPAFAPYLTVREFLSGLGNLIESEVTLRFGANQLAEHRLDRLSLGQKRRVELAAALIGDPRLILLDEPTNGLDPHGVHGLRDAIHSIIDPARLLIVASHHLDELQRLVDWLVVIDAGRVVLSCTVSEALSRFGSLDNVFQKLVSSSSAA